MVFFAFTDIDCFTNMSPDHNYHYLKKLKKSIIFHILNAKQILGGLLQYY